MRIVAGDWRKSALVKASQKGLSIKGWRYEWFTPAHVDRLESFTEVNRHLVLDGTGLLEAASFLPGASRGRSSGRQEQVYLKVRDGRQAIAVGPPAEVSALLKLASAMAQAKVAATGSASPPPAPATIPHPPGGVTAVRTSLTALANGGEGQTVTGLTKPHRQPVGKIVLIAVGGFFFLAVVSAIFGPHTAAPPIAQAAVAQPALDKVVDGDARSLPSEAKVEPHIEGGVADRDGVVRKITDSAITSIDRASDPETYREWGAAGIRRVQALKKAAAEAVAKNPQCDFESPAQTSLTLGPRPQVGQWFSWTVITRSGFSSQRRT